MKNGKRDLLSKVGVSYRKVSIWIINRSELKKNTQFVWLLGQRCVFLYRCMLALYQSNMLKEEIMRLNNYKYLVLI